eukprot:scaffold1225_cov164-Amphora_coffeaeformis.AAC.20
MDSLLKVILNRIRCFHRSSASEGPIPNPENAITVGAGVSRRKEDETMDDPKSSHSSKTTAHSILLLAAAGGI